MLAARARDKSGDMTMTYAVSFADLQPQNVAVVHGRVQVEGIRAFLAEAFSEVEQVVAEQNLHVAGAPFGRFRAGTGVELLVEVGFPISGIVTDAGRVRAGRLPGGHVARTRHVGDYGAVTAAYDAARDFVLDNGYEPTGLPWESYLDGPDVLEPRTEVFVPCRTRRPASASFIEPEG